MYMYIRCTSTCTCTQFVNFHVHVHPKNQLQNTVDSTNHTWSKNNKQILNNVPSYLHWCQNDPLQPKMNPGNPTLHRDGCQPWDGNPLRECTPQQKDKVTENVHKKIFCDRIMSPSDTQRQPCKCHWPCCAVTARSISTGKVSQKRTQCYVSCGFARYRHGCAFMTNGNLWTIHVRRNLTGKRPNHNCTEKQKEVTTCRVNKWWYRKTPTSECRSGKWGRFARWVKAGFVRVGLSRLRWSCKSVTPFELNYHQHCVEKPSSERLIQGLVTRNYVWGTARERNTTAQQVHWSVYDVTRKHSKQPNRISHTRARLLLWRATQIKDDCERTRTVVIYVRRSQI